MSPSTSSLAFGIVPVTKRDGSIRLCADYWPLNKIIEADSFSIRNMNEVLDQLVGPGTLAVFTLLKDTSRFH